MRWLPLLLPTLAFAQAGLAQRAAAAHDAYCSDIKSVDSDASAAEALVEVGAVWREVSQAHEAGGPLHLLYWKGMLASCLDQDERAVADLSAFVDQAGDDSTLTALVADATRRLRRLQPQAGAGAAPAPRPEGALIAVGGALLGAGGAFGGLAGWQANLMRDAQQTYHSGELTTQQLADEQGLGEAAAGRANGLLGASIGSAALSAVAFGVGGALLGRGAPAVAAVPTEGGVVVVGALRW